jgi:hypothetical protein
MKSRPVGAVLSNEDEEMARKTKQKAAFRNFANAPTSWRKRINTVRCQTYVSTATHLNLHKSVLFRHQQRINFYKKIMLT